MEFLHGSPADMTGRQIQEIQSYAFLERIGVDFDRTDHPEQPAASMEICREIDKVLHVSISKNLFLCNRQKTAFYLLVMPADKPFKTKELSAQLGTSRLSFADETNMQELLNTAPGSVSVLSLLFDTAHRVQLVLDEDVLKQTYFGCHPCVNTSSVRFTTKELIGRVLPALGAVPEMVQLRGW